MTVVEIKGVKFYWTRGQKSRPWLRPALQKGMEEASDVYKEHLNRKLKELETK